MMVMVMIRMIMLTWKFSLFETISAKFFTLVNTFKDDIIKMHPVKKTWGIFLVSSFKYLH